MTSPGNPGCRYSDCFACKQSEEVTGHDSKVSALDKKLIGGVSQLAALGGGKINSHTLTEVLNHLSG